MEWLSPVTAATAALAAIAALVGATATLLGLVLSDRISFLTVPGRVRSTLAKDLALLEKLEPGPGRDNLSRYVDREASRLVAYSEPPTPHERAALMMGRALAPLGGAVFAATLFALPVTLSSVDDVVALALWGVLALSTFGFFAWALQVWYRAKQTHGARRLRLLYLAWRDRAEVAAGGAGPERGRGIIEETPQGDLRSAGTKGILAHARELAGKLKSRRGDRLHSRRSGAGRERRATHPAGK